MRRLMRLWPGWTQIRAPLRRRIPGRRNLEKMQKAKPPKKYGTRSNRAPAASDPPRLARDLDGTVHTPNGFLSGVEYRKTLRENPGAGLPAFEDIPLLDG
jgi:hypothetical protein